MLSVIITNGVAQHSEYIYPRVQKPRKDYSTKPMCVPTSYFSITTSASVIIDIISVLVVNLCVLSVSYNLYALIQYKYIHVYPYDKYIQCCIVIIVVILYCFSVI